MKKDVKRGSASNKLAVIAHILGILTFFVGPLLVRKFSKDMFTKIHATKALNWQINVILYLLTGLILKVIIIGYVMIPIILVLNIALPIIAAIKASKNEFWDYPLSFSFFE